MGNFIVKILKFQYNYIVKKKKKADRIIEEANELVKEGY